MFKSNDPQSLTKLLEKPLTGNKLTKKLSFKQGRGFQHHGQHRIILQHVIL